MKTFDEFVSLVKDSINNYLSPEFQGANISVRKIDKLNYSYTGLSILKDDDNVSAVVNLDDFYQEYLNGESFSRLMSMVAHTAQMRPELPFLAKRLDYNNIKNNLFIRVSDNKNEANQDILNNVPHTDINGVAVTYHLLIEDFAPDGNKASALITNSILESFGISKEQLHRDALENSLRLNPPLISSIENVIGQLLGNDKDSRTVYRGDFEHQLADTDVENVFMLVLTNSDMNFGAATIMYPEILSRIGDRLGTNYYILPSSVHEVLILPDTGEQDSTELTGIVSDINFNEVKAQDKFSDTVFYFDNDSKTFEIAADSFVKDNEFEMEH